MAATTFQVAEYRPPDFLVHMTADSMVHYSGDTTHALVTANYLFGAPVGGVNVYWEGTLKHLSPWQLSIPKTDGYLIGDAAWGWDGTERSQPEVVRGRDTLDAAGRVAISAVVPTDTTGLPGEFAVTAEVTDVNHQVISASTTMMVRPATVYVAAQFQPRVPGFGETGVRDDPVRCRAVQRPTIAVQRPSDCRRAAIYRHRHGAVHDIASPCNSPSYSACRSTPNSAWDIRFVTGELGLIQG